MPNRKHRYIFFIALMALLMPYGLFAQAPAITYNLVPAIFPINSPITPLTPTNSGGAIPPAIYGLVTTIAGGLAGSADGTGNAARFNQPIDITFDKNANVFYIADYGNYAIRKMTPGGVVTTLAGGTAGYADGMGRAAKFNTPYSVGCDASGNVWVGEMPNNTIRKIDPLGNVTTLAGQAGTAGSTDGMGASARFTGPSGMTFDAAGNLYECDNGVGLIRKINTTTGLVETFAGNVAKITTTGIGIGASFKGPRDLAFDKQGNLYVTDNTEINIKKIDMTTLQVTVVANTIYPYSIVVNAGGTIYISDFVDNIIKELSPSGKISVVAGTTNRAGFADGVGTAATFTNPYGMTLDDQSNMYVTDFGNNLIRKINLSGYAIDKALPTGLSFDSKTGIITGTPTASWPLTAYTITGYNANGSSETVINLQVSEPTVITFNPLPSKVMCDADFDPGATSAQAITYTSSNTAVATIVANKIHITGAGTSTITAINGGTPVTQLLTVTALTIVPSVTIKAEIATATCTGRILGFDATVTNAGNNPTYQWKVNGTNSGINSPVYNSSTLNNNDAITCTVTNNDYCVQFVSPVSNIVKAQVNPLVTASVTISASATTVYSDEPVIFTANPVNAAPVNSYQWYINAATAGTSTPTFTSSKLKDGDVVTLSIVSGGCTVDSIIMSNAITITIKPVVSIIVPNTFTPNGDGINDVWNILAIGAFPNSTVDVYNRYGALVYHSIGYPKPWDGTSNNQALPVGTYYYVIDPKDDHQKIVKGWLSILR